MPRRRGDTEGTTPGTSFLAWQWEGYARFHRDRGNLLIHIVAVPVFVAGCLSIPAGLALSQPLVAGAGLAALVIGLAAQGRGHTRERNPPEPFSGPGQFVARILAEQFVSFPRFVVTGGWLESLHDAPHPQSGGPGAVD